MRIEIWKFDIVCARVCMTRADVSKKAGIPLNTLKTCLYRGGSPLNVGKIARALGVDVLDILADEDIKKYTSASGKDGDTC